MMRAHLPKNHDSWNEVLHVPSNKGLCVFVHASLLMYYMRLSGYASFSTIVLFPMRLFQLLLCVFLALRLFALLYYMRLLGYASF